MTCGITITQYAFDTLLASLYYLGTLVLTAVFAETCHIQHSRATQLIQEPTELVPTMKENTLKGYGNG